MGRKLYRSRTDKMLGGVCAGLGELLDIDPTIVRLVFVLLTIWGGAGAIVYLVLWLIAPYKDELKNP
jgi:phage shock protein C